MTDTTILTQNSTVRLVGCWCLMALSAQKGYIVPFEN